MKEKSTQKPQTKIGLDANGQELVKATILIPMDLYEFAEARAKELSPGMRPNISLAMRDILTKEKSRVERSKN